ncbi:MAG: hypothetical protein JSV03_14610, partial [Planctomycetota bacterium]
MKKLITTVIVLAVIVGGFFWLRKYARVSLSVLEGETAKTYRGDLVVPITASGNIKPASVTKIKGKASGEVVEIPFDVGEMVKGDDLIVRLDESDEQRNVDRTSADYERAKITYRQATITKEELEQVGVKLAAAKLKQADARFIRADATYRHNMPKTRPYDGLPRTVSAEEWDQIYSNRQEALAAKEAAEAERRKADIEVQKAEQDVKIAEQNEEAAKKAWEEADQRLKETKVYSPIDGMILAREVQIGEMVQSGTTSLTGGTILVEIADVSD